MPREKIREGLLAGLAIDYCASTTPPWRRPRRAAAISQAKTQRITNVMTKDVIAALETASLRESRTSC